MKKTFSLLLAVALLFSISSCAKPVVDADSLIKKLMDSAEANGYAVYDTEPRTSEKSDDVYGDYIEDSYILYNGVYAYLYKTVDTGELLYINIWGDKSMMDSDALNVCGYYTGGLLSELEGNGASKVATALGMYDFNAYQTQSNPADGAAGKYTFSVVPSAIALEYAISK